MARDFSSRLAAGPSLWLAAGLAAAGLWAVPSHAYADDGHRVALVIGISSYERLPKDIALDTARSEAVNLAQSLERDGGYDKVRLLTDASATVKNLDSALREQIPADVGPNDSFLLYFVGHGVGADFGEPRILLYDTDPDALDATSMSLATLSALVEKYVHCKGFVVAFDAAHTGTLNNLALLGPTGDDWPGRGRSSLVVSAAAPRQTGRPGIFAGAFLDGVAGRADDNHDGLVTGSELNNYLVRVVPDSTSGTQTPTVNSTYDPTLVVSAVKVAQAAQAVAEGPGAPAPVMSNVRVDKAKFVFQGGTHQSVTCSSAPPVACDPACYVWDVPAGTCTVSMSVNGEDVSGDVSVLYRGAYTCGTFQGGLRCSSPPPP